MTTKKQEEWLNHLTDDDHVIIVPFNPNVKKIFKDVKQQLQAILGKQVEIVHRGASSMGISGQGDIDIYIPVEAQFFNNYLSKLVEALGKPGSLYPLERARWVKKIEGVRVETFLMNNEHPAWITSTIFEAYLRTHPISLTKYEKIKQDAEGKSTREYYRVKIEFINKILRLAKKK